MCVCVCVCVYVYMNIDSCFIDKDHGDILTEDLNIINKNISRKCFTKSAKYRESMSVNFKGTWSDLITCIDKCFKPSR